MAAATATGYVIPQFTVVSTITSSKTNSSKPKNKVSVRRLKLFGGLKPENKVMNLGVPHSTEQQFGRLLTVCNAFRGKSRGGALTSTCDHISETIFRVVPIMSGLVLVGVALGFVLLRVEAALEESDFPLAKEVGLILWYIGGVFDLRVTSSVRMKHHMHHDISPMWMASCNCEHETGISIT